MSDDDKATEEKGDEVLMGILGVDRSTREHLASILGSEHDRFAGYEAHASKQGLPAYAARQRLMLDLIERVGKMLLAEPKLASGAKGGDG